MDLFQNSAQEFGLTLSEKLRPKDLDQIKGQKTLLSSQSALRRLIEAGQIPNLILWGPPGTGKTTLALAISQFSKAQFIQMNAVESGAKSLREAGQEGQNRRILHQQKTILFIDEIHRLNKSQQDVLLPYIEKGDLILIGATTENPSYELNKAVLSRCRVVVFERLSREDLLEIIQQAAVQTQIPFVNLLKSESLDYLIESSDGDARRLINSLEILANSYSHPGNEPMGLEALKNLLNTPGLSYDKNSEFHYDLISAFIKSVRGSDPDAALYYLVRMLEGGEDPIFICRRLIILASEDIGNAEPHALSMATSALHALESIGLPEGALVLSQVTTYLATCPKSNASYLALKKAQEFVRKTRSAPVPLALRSSKTELSKNLGYGKDYEYPHNLPKAWSEQNYWPEEMTPQKFYEPSPRGFEKKIREYQSWVKGSKSPDTHKD